MTSIAYLVQDLTDPAVARRVRMFVAGGASLRLAGFRRREVAGPVAGILPVDLGRTTDLKLADRLLAVTRQLARPGRLRAVTRGADVIVARNLEMLALAVRVARPGQRIVFECLDIHRLLLADGAAGRAIRAVERRLMRRVALLLTSSPAFAREYFVGRQHYAVPIRVEENKVLRLDDAPAAAPAPPVPAPAAPPWRIGWLGMLRCRRSLAILRDLVRNSGGRVEVLIAGVPTLAAFDDFHRDVADVPGLRFIGAYTAADLARLYGEVHFAWAIDYFEEGRNSAWLLPNRLYESIDHGAVPIALAGVETGRWLDRHRAGLVVGDPAAELGAMFDGLDADTLGTLRRGISNVPRGDLVATRADCAALTRAVAGVAA